jgi:hypothetical protein
VTAVVAALVIAAIDAGIAAGHSRAGFVPYVERSFSQNALGDFDGDGRSDVARIQPRDGTGGISVQLSASSMDVHLDGAVAVLIDDDVDHDGDLDLVAATSDGHVLIWLNDGHGQFTPQAPARSTGSVTAAASISAASPLLIAAGQISPALPSPSRSRSAVVATRIRPPTAVGMSFRRHVVPPLRAPPLSV